MSIFVSGSFQLSFIRVNKGVLLYVIIMRYYNDGVVLRLVYCITMWSVSSDRDELIFLCVVCDICIDIFESIIRCRCSSSHCRSCIVL